MAAVNEPSGSIWIINPDELASRIVEQEGLALQPANLEAVQRIEAWLFTSLDAYQTIGVETVNSTDKYRALIEHARRRGFSISLIYVFLETVDLNIERVETRVRKGGHAVPEDKIRSRRERSFGQFGWFFDAAHTADVYDNSGARPQLVMTKRGDEVSVYDDLPDGMLASLEQVMPGFGAIYDGD
jgi:predicted ABC-type ATPase